MKIFLIRHGESSHNADHNKLSGITDVDLTDIGKEQCCSLSSYFKGIDMRVIASPLKRSYKSAQYIFPDKIDKIEISSEIIEINYGKYEGIDPTTISNDPIIEKWNTDPNNLTFPNGDNVNDHANLVFKGLKKLARPTQKKSICCVSHRTTIRLLIAKIMNIPFKFFRDIPCDNCYVTELIFDSNSFFIKTLNAPFDPLKGLK